MISVRKRGHNISIDVYFSVVIESLKNCLLRCLPHCLFRPLLLLLRVLSKIPFSVNI